MHDEVLRFFKESLINSESDYGRKWIKLLNVLKC